jgi:hypothetical protein
MDSFPPGNNCADLFVGAKRRRHSQRVEMFVSQRRRRERARAVDPADGGDPSAREKGASQPPSRVKNKSKTKELHSQHKVFELL